MPRLLITTDLTLYQALHTVAAEYPERPAITFGAQTLTYHQLNDRIDALARQLRELGVGPGDRVAIILPNCLEFVYAFFAPAALGAVVVPLNPVYRQQEFKQILADSEASVVIAAPKHMGNDIQGILESLRSTLPALQHVILDGQASSGFLSLADLESTNTPLNQEGISPDDLCALVYTSGTTGVPKAVMHNHRSMLSAVVQSEGRFKMPLPRRLGRLLKLVRRYDSRFLRYGLKQYTYTSAAGLHTLLGYNALVYALMYGFRVVITDRFHPAHVLALIERERITAITLAPTMVMALLNSPAFPDHDYSSLLYVVMASAPCPPDLVRRARKAFGCPVVIAFGATEVGGATLMTDVVNDREDLQAETVGQLFQGMEAKVVDEQRRAVPAGNMGELALRLRSTMLGYYKSPQTTAEALDEEGWYYTGDLATLDEQGYVRIVGRKKNMIIRGGQNVYPAEIEHHLLGMPGIKNVAVVGVPDSFMGEAVYAFVEPEEGSELTPQAVWDHCRGQLAPYKVPDQVRIIDALPLTPTGKVQTFLLREMVTGEESSPAPQTTTD